MSSLVLLAQVGSGKITGGWGYVYASYAATFLAIILYSLSLFFRNERTPDAPPPAAKDPQS